MLDCVRECGFERTHIQRIKLRDRTHTSVAIEMHGGGK